MSTMLIDNVVLSDEDFRAISDMVYDHCGIHLHDGKKELVRARLAKLLRQRGCAEFPQYMRHVLEDTSGREFSLLIDAVSTNLTSFFREEGHFEFLAGRFLPALVEKKRRAGSLRVRGWSAGCSSGEEPYSIAITLIESLPGRERFDVKVLATDISTSILDKARLGVYDAERTAPVPPALKSRYLVGHKVNGRRVFDVGPALRRVVVFKYLNLMQDWPIRGPLDFIFCRNVMIYFDKPSQQRLIRRFYDLLDSGGVLFTGHSESLTGIEHAFRYIQPTIYAKP